MTENSGSQAEKAVQNESSEQMQIPAVAIPLTKDIKYNNLFFSSLYQDSSDIVFRPIKVDNKEAIIIYIEGLTDTQKLDEQVIEILLHMQIQANQANQASTNNNVISTIRDSLPISSIKEVNTFKSCTDELANGQAIFLLDGFEVALSLGLVKFEKRSIEEPQAENAIRGPREGFTESIGVNTSLVRRIIKDPALKMKTIQIGTHTKTKVVISYIEGLVDKTLITEIENRINRIKIDGILESGYIEQFIEDNPYSPFPQLLYTERPDVVSANLLEGRAVILTEGTPFCLIAPISFFSLFQSQEDFYERFWISTFMRILRFIFLLIALFLPAVYVAITTYHQEMVPTDLLLSIASAREGIPFPAIVEVIIMEITFEALREAGIRLPKQIGSAVSIVGGQGAVQAGIVSATMVIVVSITGIASFLIPRYSIGISIRLLRFPVIVLAGVLGLIGVMLAFITIIIHLASLKSFGVPYLSPLGTLQKPAMKDTLIRSPLWKMNLRPHLTGNYNPTKQSENLKPGVKNQDE